jgi:putative ABC transport system substrate-binding protein
MLTGSDFVENTVRRRFLVCRNWDGAYEARNRRSEMTILVVRRRQRGSVLLGRTGSGPGVPAAAGIVFAFGGDPVAIGLVPSLNRPGGNVTGATNLATDLVAKQLELLRETVPAVTLIGFLVHPDSSPDTPTKIKEAGRAAQFSGCV